jgi:hypothetical protein
LSAGAAEWNGVDEVVFGMLTALEGGGFCPALDDISLQYWSFNREIPINQTRQRDETSQLAKRKMRGSMGTG